MTPQINQHIARAFSFFFHRTRSIDKQRHNNIMIFKHTIARFSLNAHITGIYCKKQRSIRTVCFLSAQSQFNHTTLYIRNQYFLSHAARSLNQLRYAIYEYTHVSVFDGNASVLKKPRHTIYHFQRIRTWRSRARSQVLSRVCGARKTSSSLICWRILAARCDVVARVTHVWSVMYGWNVLFFEKNIII